MNIMIPGAYWVNMASVPWAVNGIDPYHLTRATIDGRKVVRELQKFFQDRVPGMDRAEVIETAAKIGVRETRRVSPMPLDRIIPMPRADLVIPA